MTTVRTSQAPPGHSTTPHPPPGTSASPDRSLAIDARDLEKTYGKGDRAVHALRGVSIAVPRGTVFGLLGPNGAGKSTTVKILTTLTLADAGSAMVAGADVRRAPADVRRRIGYVSQRPGFDPMGTGRENLVLQGRIFELSRLRARARASELLDRFGLKDAGDRLTRTWSGGMQRKLDVAMGLVHRPEVLFLDEPTTGLDPEARTDMWQEIAALTRTDGLTVLLTTHYLDEADHLAENLAIVDRGEVVAAGTPDELKRALGGDTIDLLFRAAVDGARAAEVLQAVPGVTGVTADAAAVRATVTAGATVLAPVLSALEAAGLEPAAVTMARPTLDDVYLRVAGRAFARAEQEADAVSGGAR